MTALRRTRGHDGGVRRGLGLGTRGPEWAVDAYTVVMAGLLIASGALADRFGRRRVFRCGPAVFGVASVACAVAPSLGFLVAARASRAAAPARKPA